MNETEWFCGRGVDDDETRMECYSARRLAATIFLCGVGLALLGIIGGCASTPEPTVSAVQNPDASLVFRAKHDDGSPVALRIFTERPCTDDRVLLYLVHKFGAPQEMLPQFKAAILTWQGKDWASCWIEQQGYVVSVDEEGAPFQPVPREAFAREGV